MSNYKEIKFLYYSSIIFFYFIIWESILNVFEIYKGINIIILILSFIVVFFVDYLMDKVKKSYIAFFVPILVSGAILYIIYGGFSQIYNIILIALCVSIAGKDKNEFLNYDYYSDSVKKKIGILLLTDTIVAISGSVASGGYYKSGILLLSISFLILSVVLLRDGRNFSHGISNTKARKFNIVIVAIAFLMSIPVVGKKLILLLSIINKGFSIAYEQFCLVLSKYILWPFVMYILYPICRFIAAIFRALFARRKALKPKVNVTNPKFKQNKADIIKSFKMPDSVKKILAVIVLAAILYLIYLLYTKRKKNKMTFNDDVLEEREKIDDVGSRKERPHLGKRIMDFLRGETNSKKVRNVYKEFEKDTFKKGIFKKYMTATRLKNVSSAYINSKDDLEDMTNVYNEARFSNHDIDDDKVHTVRNNYSKIKKEL